MSRINEIPNSELAELINKHYESPFWRKVMYDRFINGLSCEEILRKIYPSWGWLSKRVQVQKIALLRNSCYRFENFVLKGETEK